LFLKCCNGTHFDEGVLTVREAAGEAPLEYLTINMKQVFIDSISWGAASGGGKPSESVSISFAEVKFEYFAQTETGGKGEKGVGGWNVQTNAAAA
jgi:type VI secretion system secreted protein Hcp